MAFKTEAPDHVSSWKQFCKVKMSLFNILSIFRQLTSAVAHLHSKGIIHRDVHPTRLHLNNGLLKFNTIGLPYNFKKLLKNPNYSGHVSYSAPELISEEKGFSFNTDTWSLGCVLYYLVTKQDPFQADSIDQTKRNILELKLDESNILKFHNEILQRLIYQCLERNPEMRMTCEQILAFQDELELAYFKMPLSKMHYELLMRDTQLEDKLAERVAQNADPQKFQGTSLELRNNPWFFSKEYGTRTMTGDEDFYILVETHVGNSKLLRTELFAEQQLLQECQLSDSSAASQSSSKKSRKGPKRYPKKASRN